MEYAVTQSSGQGQQEYDDAADKAAFLAVPPGKLPDTGQYVLKYGEFRRERGKNHEEEKQCSPDAASRHVIEHGRHGVKKKGRSCVDLDAVCIAGREYDQSGHDRDERIQADYIH